MHVVWADGGRPSPSNKSYLGLASRAAAIFVGLMCRGGGLTHRGGGLTPPGGCLTRLGMVVVRDVSK